MDKNYNPPHSARCTAIFEFFWGGTWGCEKIWEWVLYFCVLLHFMLQLFKVFWGGTWGAPLLLPPVCIYPRICFTYAKVCCNFWFLNLIFLEVLPSFRLLARLDQQNCVAHFEVGEELTKVGNLKIKQDEVERKLI